MSNLPALAALALGLSGFWLIDRVVRLQHGLKIVKRREGTTQWGRFAVLLSIAAAGSFLATGADVPLGLPMRLLLAVLVFVLTWKHVTQDIDVVVSDSLWRERLLLLALGVVSWFLPFFLLPWLYLVLHSFSGWTHHGTLPARLVMMFLGAFAFVVAPSNALPEYGIAQRPGVGEALLVLIVACHVSHYVIPALGKMKLGRHPLSWALENRLHAVSAGAYSWGWARFLPKSKAVAVLKALAPFDRPLQVVTLLLEFGAAFALFHRTAFYEIAFGLVGMHLVIFLTTGILFWEWILVDATLCETMHLLEPESVALVFSPESGLACLALVFLFPARGKLWRPVWLAWWDTPFTARIHWEVVGESGKSYGLYNDYLAPHERLFGRVHGYFLVAEPLVTYHLGQIYPAAESEHHKKSIAPFEAYRAEELRDLVFASRGDPERLASIKARFGAVRRDPAAEREHVRYLRRFLRAVSRGDRKHVLPRPLRFLTAPGGQYYYWGELPGYRGQEPARRLRFRYREEFFDGEDFRVIADRVVREVPLRASRREGGADARITATPGSAA